MNRNVKIDDGILICPACGSLFTHHGNTEIFERDEDEKKGMHIVSKKKSIKIDDDITDNPSSRRHGLRISFYCEQCGGTFKVAIAQHKGQTLISCDIK